MKKANSNFNITTGQQQSNPLLEKMFQNAGIDTPIEEITQSWDEVESIYQTVAESIVSIAMEVNQTIMLINELGTISNVELEVSVRGLTGDIEAFTKDMVLIKSRHIGKTGKVKDADELSLCLGIFSDYMILYDRFRALVFPVVTTVTEYLAEAIEMKRKIDAATDVNVITDVEVKEITK